MTLLDELTELYWATGEYGIDDPRRMGCVMHHLALTIRTWAPREDQARVCHLAINEVADRLIRETTIREDNENPD